MSKKLSNLDLDRLFSNLKEDSDGRLYWRNKKIRNEGIDLSKWIPIAISIIALLLTFLANREKILSIKDSFISSQQSINNQKGALKFTDSDSSPSIADGSMRNSK